MTLSLKCSTLISFPNMLWKAFVSKEAPAASPKAFITVAGRKWRVQSDVRSRLMTDGSLWAAPSSNADKKARAVVSICSLRFVVGGTRAMSRSYVAVCWVLKVLFRMLLARKLMQWLHIELRLMPAYSPCRVTVSTCPTPLLYGTTWCFLQLTFILAWCFTNITCLHNVM